MLFDVTFSDGSVRTFQAHNKKQLEMALKNVIIKPHVQNVGTHDDQLYWLSSDDEQARQWRIANGMEE